MVAGMVNDHFGYDLVFLDAAAAGVVALVVFAIRMREQSTRTSACKFALLYISGFTTCHSVQVSITSNGESFA